MHRLPTFTRILSALINKYLFVDITDKIIVNTVALINKYLFVDITDKIIVNTVVDSVDNLNKAILYSARL